MAKSAKSRFTIKLSLDSKEYRNNLKHARQKLNKTFGGTWVYLSRRAEKITKTIAGLGSVLTIVSVKASAEFEKQKVSLERILGSAEAAQKKIRSLRDFASRTPFTFDQLLKYEKRLLAMGFAAENTETLLESLGNAASGLGIGTYGLDSLIKAISDIQAKGVLQTQEMRQLAEAGIPGWEMLAKSIGKSIPEAMKLVERRAISSGQAITAILDGINERFSGMMDKQSKTLSGVWTNILGEFNSIMASIGTAINYNGWITKAAGALLEQIRQIRIEIDTIGTLAAFKALMSGKLGDALMAVVSILTLSLVPALYKVVTILPFLKASTLGHLAIFAAIGLAANNALKNWEIIFLALDDTIGRFLRYVWYDGKRMIEKLKGLSGYFFHKLKDKAGETLKDLSGYLKDFEKLTARFFNSIREMAVDFARCFVVIVGDVFEDIGSKFKKIKFLDGFGKRLEKAGRDFKDNKTIENALGKIPGFFNKKFIGFFDSASKELNDFGNKVIGQSKKLKEEYKKIYDNAANVLNVDMKSINEKFILGGGDERRQYLKRRAELKKLLGLEAFAKITENGAINLKKAWEVYIKPPFKKIIDPYKEFFQKLLRMDPASKLRRQLQEKSLAYTAAAEAAKMKTDAERLSSDIERQWIQQTKSKLEQLEIQYAAEKEQLVKLKDSNENYLRDLERLAAIYEPQIAEERQKQAFEEFSRMSDEALRKTQSFGRAMAEQASQVSEAYRKAAESLSLSRFSGNKESINRGLEIGDWSLIQENLTREYAAHEAHVKGIQELYHTKSNFMIEAARSAASYTAEVYNYMYNSVSQGITDLIVSGKSFGDILKNIGNELIAMVVKWTVQRRTAAAFSKKLSVAEAGQSAALAKTTAAAWADAAALVSLATFGANAAAAAAGMASVAGMAKGMAFLADGGVVTKPTIAMIGEGGEPEAVIPLSKFKEMKGGDVAVNVYNNTSAEVKTKTSFDGTKTIIDFFIDGYSRNVNGVRDIVRSY